MIAALHQATPAIRGLAPRHVPGFACRDDMDAFLRDPGRPWAGGPFSEPARRLLVTCVITLYRSRWYLDDLASAIRLFRNPHRDTPDTRRWRDSLAPGLEQLPRWLELLS